MGNFKFKYGIVTDVSRDGIEITEQQKNFKPKRTQWWVEWPEPFKTMPVGTRVSYIETKPKKHPAFIRDIETRYD